VNTFTQSQRLKSAQEFKQVWRAARRHSNKYLSIYYCPNNLGYPRLGLSLSKKNIRNATDRNRLKRVARETFRLNQRHLGSHDMIVVIYKGADQQSPAEQQQTFKNLWQRLRGQANKIV
jgi:ribonuclease P protein component